jgi:hypothetical protein
MNSSETTIDEHLDSSTNIVLSSLEKTEGGFDLTGSSEIPQNSYKTIINHPLDPSRNIILSSLEGTEVGIYFRGSSEIPENQNSIQINLPEYLQLISSNFSIQITPIASRNHVCSAPFVVPFHCCSEVEDNNFIVFGPPGKFYWHLYATRMSYDSTPLKDSI